MKYKFGRKPVKYTPMMKMSQVSDTLPPPDSENLKFQAVLEWILGGNDEYGDCVFVAGANGILLTSTLSGSAIRLTTDDCLKFYSIVTKFNPSNPLSDEGVAETDFLTAWRTNGYPNGEDIKDTLIGSVYIDPKNHYQIQQAIDTLGVCLCGVNFPTYWEEIIDEPEWPLPPAGVDTSSAGGHGMAVVGYDSKGFYVISWAMVKHVPYDAFDAYTEEVYGLLLKDWLSKNGNTPYGQTFSELLTAMTML